MDFEAKLAAEWATKIRALHEANASSSKLVPSTETSQDQPTITTPKAHVIRTESKRHMTKRRLKLLANPDDENVVYDRPKTRGDCLTMERPCPFVSCKYHLYLDVMSSGSIHHNFPDLEVWELIDTCTLDVAEDGDVARPGAGEGEGATLEQLGLLFNVTRERIRQIEVTALEKLARKARTLRDFADGYGMPQRRRTNTKDDDADEREEDDEENHEG
jgi:hypothetical protein